MVLKLFGAWSSYVTYLQNFSDPEVNEKVESWARVLRPKLQQVKGFTRVFQRKTNFQDGLFESNIGNLITDALVEMVSELSSTR